MSRAAVGEARDWDADVYDRVSDVQLEWGLEVLERLPLSGHESVLDAGCGTGRVTQALAKRLPRGRVVAVDASPAMVERARAHLPANCSVAVADLSELELDSPVDAVLSTAVFHWIPDHRRLFERLREALRPGGRLVAQCGGEGNVASLAAIIDEVSTQPRFATYLAGWNGPWNFRAPAAAAQDLARTGFGDVDCWLERKPVAPADPRAYLETVTLGVHLERLPQELRAPFVDSVLQRMPEPPTLDYVRLNIEARRP